MLSPSDFKIFRWRDSVLGRYVYRCRLVRIEERTTTLNSSKEINDYACEGVFHAHLFRAYDDIKRDLYLLEVDIARESSGICGNVALDRVRRIIEKLQFPLDQGPLPEVVDKGELVRTP